MFIFIYTRNMHDINTYGVHYTCTSQQLAQSIKYIQNYFIMKYNNLIDI